MSYTYKLKGARWLRKYTAAAPSPVYAAASDAQNIADTFCDVPWTRAESDGPAMFPQHDAKALDANPGNRDLFDAAAFCAHHVNGSHMVYANAAFYLFALPAAAQGKTLELVKLHLSSDPYNEYGARIAVHLLASPTLPTDCATVRTGDAHADGQVPRTTQTVDGVDYWYGASGDVTVALPENSVTTAYLGVFVGLETYARVRGDWIEGASYIRNAIEITTSAAINGWTSGSSETIDCSDAGVATLLAGGSSPTWLQPMQTVNVGTDAPEVPSGDLVENRVSAAQTNYTAQAGSCRADFSTNFQEGYVELSFYGLNFTAKKVYWRQRGSSGDYSSASLNYGSFYSSSDGQYQWAYITGELPAHYGGYTTSTGTAYLCIGILQLTITRSTADPTTVSVRITGLKAYDSSKGQFGWQVTGTQTFNQSFSFTKDAYVATVYYVLLELTNGTPSSGDICDSETGEGRHNATASVDGSASPWTVTIDGVSYSVTKSGSTVTMKRADTVIGSWTSQYGTSNFFDASVRSRLDGVSAHDTVAQYGLAAALGDFSSAVATFEAGAQPSDAELLGRLCRMSRKSASGMMYLHPAVAALADELDSLRPVPRFFRTSSTPPTQTTCQPGLSVWYYRPNTSGTVNPSAAAAVLAYRDGAVASVVKVTNPVFLQYALLALRSPSAFAGKLVLTNGNSAQDNGFRLRFVAWVSPADQWDGSNAFAMAAMGSMPSIYRSDGEDSVSWSVDCSGLLMPLGTRAMTARRIGVSEVVDGDIAANARIDIPLAGKVGEGDVLLIAPEVIGFAAGAEGVSVHFGRQAAPSASANNGAWARYAQDLGWFPQVTGE